MRIKQVQKPTRAGPILEEILTVTGAIAGQTSLALEVKRPVSRDQLMKWQRELKEASKNIELLLGGNRE
jgi:hypothetical protein